MCGILSLSKGMEGRMPHEKQALDTELFCAAAKRSRMPNTALNPQCLRSYDVELDDYDKQ